MRILVTGGAGYVGSHVVLALQDAGHEVTVLDDLSAGFRDAVPAGVGFVEGSTGDAALVDRLIGERRPEAVMHFAASVSVPESVALPLKYYRNNTLGSLTLLEGCVRHGVGRFVFSSTAAVYGEAEAVPIAEDAPKQPINPYGASKLMTERMLADVAAAHPLRYVALRYFNVAGADAQGRAGQSTRGATHLIKVACEAALGKRPEIAVYGTDYPTADGSCVRDYIHVGDLAEVHLRALDYLAGGGDSATLNAGYGHGTSVREVLAAVERAVGHPLPRREAERRPGDPAALVAKVEKIRAALGWTPRYDDLDFIVRTALAWEGRR